MIKSLAFNAIILYLLFKTPVSEFAISSLPGYLAGLKSFRQLWDALVQLAWKGGRMTRRMTAVVLFLAAFLVIKKIWQHLRAQEILGSFVERYLCDKQSASYEGVISAVTSESSRKRNQRKASQAPGARSQANILQQTPSTEMASLPLYSSGLISHKLLQRKSKSLRMKGLSETKRQLPIRVIGTIVEEDCCPPNGGSDKIYQSPSFSSTEDETCTNEVGERRVSWDQQGSSHETQPKEVEELMKGQECGSADIEFIDQMLDFCYI